MPQLKGEVKTPGRVESNGSSPALEGSEHLAFASLLQNMLGGSGAVFMDPAASLAESENRRAESQPALEEPERIDREEGTLEKKTLEDIPLDLYRLLFPEGDFRTVSHSELPEGQSEALQSVQERPDHRLMTKEALAYQDTLRLEKDAVETKPVREFRFSEAEPAADIVDALQTSDQEQGLGTEVHDLAEVLVPQARESFIRQDYEVNGNVNLAETEGQAADRFEPESVSVGADKPSADGVPKGNDGKPDMPLQGKGNHPLPFFLREIREEIQSIQAGGEGKEDVLFNLEKDRNGELTPVIQTPWNGSNGAVWEPVREESLVSGGNALSESIIEQVTAGIKVSNRDQGSQLELQLKPEGLGRLTIKLSLQDGEMRARIITDNLQVREILQQEAHTLQNILRHEHIDFTQLEVVYWQAPGMEMFHHGGAPYREGHRGSSAPQDRGRIREGNSEDGRIPEKAPATGLLNYLI
ncbi:MAG: flagellar hook-length control protein FliK [Clostridia bacterium]